MTTTTVEQTVNFPAGLERTFRAIADATEHAAFTGAPASFPSEVGGAFTTHGGNIEGRRGGATRSAVLGAERCHSALDHRSALAW